MHRRQTAATEFAKGIAFGGVLKYNVERTGYPTTNVKEDYVP